MTHDPRDRHDDDLYAAPIRAIDVKRAYEANPVTTRRRAGGLTVFRDPSSQLPGPAAAQLGVKLERPQPRSGEDERA